MITNDVQFEKQEKKELPIIPVNVYQAEIVDFEEKEELTYDSKKDPSLPQVTETIYSCTYKLLNGTDKGESLRGRLIWLNFIPGYFYIGKNGRNKLYQVIESALGRELSIEEENDFSALKLNKLIGKQVRFGIKHTVSKKGDTFSNISEFYAVEEQLEPLTDKEKEKAPSDEVVEKPAMTEQEFIQQDDDEVKLEDITFS